MGPGPTRSIKMKCGAREDDQGEPSGGGPLGGDAFAAARERPVTEHHRQRGGTTVLARYLAYRRDAFHHVPAVAWVREVDGRRGPRRAEIAAARQDTADERERSCADRV